MEQITWTAIETPDFFDYTPRADKVLRNDLIVIGIKKVGHIVPKWDTPYVDGPAGAFTCIGRHVVTDELPDNLAVVCKTVTLVAPDKTFKTYKVTRQ